LLALIVLSGLGILIIDIWLINLFKLYYYSDKA
jgi:hypothetical protein